MINNMRWCRKLIGHRHITDRYVALHHKHLRNASSSLQGDAQLTLAYNMNKNSRLMLHNSLFMSSSFSKIVICHLHIVYCGGWNISLRNGMSCNLGYRSGLRCKVWWLIFEKWGVCNDGAYLLHLKLIEPHLNRYFCTSNWHRDSCA